MDSSPVRLSCEQCRRRKTKCDKGAPCSACKNAQLSCTAVQRARLPRGRTGRPQNKSTILQSRLSRLEDLVKQLEVTIPRQSRVTRLLILQ